jgi:hypothetical protein
MLGRIQVHSGEDWIGVYDYFYSRDDIVNELMPRGGTVELKRGGYGRVIMSEGESNGLGGFYWVNWSTAGDVIVESGN